MNRNRDPGETNTLGKSASALPNFGDGLNGHPHDKSLIRSCRLLLFLLLLGQLTGCATVRSRPDNFPPQDLDANGKWISGEEVLTDVLEVLKFVGKFFSGEY